MATQLVDSESLYQAAFRTLQIRNPEAGASWLQRLRERAMESFLRTGFPTIDQEEWKYTNLATLAKSAFKPVIDADATAEITRADLSEFSYPEAVNSQLVLVNGILRSELSSLPHLSEVVAIDLADAIRDERYEKTVREYLARDADYSVNGLTALNTALISSGAFILVPRNVKVEVPLHLLCVAAPQDGLAANFPRVLVVLEENSSATIIESYEGFGEGEYFTNAVVEVVLQDGARLEHYRVQRESDKSYHVATTTADLGRASSYDATSINLGGRISRDNLNVQMDHEGAECWLDGLYIAGSDQHIDTHSMIDHRQPHCTSRQLYKGILEGNGRAVFNGKVFVRPGAQQTDAMQTNKNLLLSPNARVDTKPQLEIYADDVKCAHGAAVGQIDEEQLFYLETRGLHPELGQNLLTYGFAEEVISKIKIESIKDQLDEVVLNRLHARLEV
jgi:Fe-S cluster assembly protein SufD